MAAARPKAVAISASDIPGATDARLAEPDRLRFQRLMSCEDQDLFAWFLRREQPEDEELRSIVSKVLEFTRTAPDDK